METLFNFIDGEFVPPKSLQYIDNVEPASGQVYAQIPRSTKEDVEAAVQAAKKAFPIWSQMSIEDRSQILMKLSQLVEARLEEFAKAESKDNGKPVTLARAVDIPRAVSNLKFFAHAITQFASEAHSMTGVAVNYTLRQPIGVVSCISPWNLPLYLFTWKVAPALAAGNTVVAKPSEVTPYTAYLLAQLCDEAGMPDGVFNILHGYGHEVGAAMVEHPEVKAISFTGGTKTGATIARVAAPMFKKLSLELGGKNPNIIFADCDYDEMIKTSVRSSFANQGQICLCGSRILVEESIYEQFKEDFVAKVSAMQIGDPNRDDTKMGALVSEAHMEKVLACIDLAKEEGGKILTGGKRVFLEGRCEKGYFVEPTVIEGLGPLCRTNTEEIFGPVVTLQSFKTEEEALELANSTMYGLSCSLWTNDIKRAHRMAAQIEAGIVWINTWLLRDLRTPFGGIKNSGVGREGGFEALRFFTEPKNVCIKL
jgi:aminomuconate-semialdehyde/2-hydroxymuconate-6-semialdehyde dehydrogenase